jgi:hypothetical protein
MVQATELTLGIRTAITHPGKGHESHVSGPTVAVRRDGVVLVSWIAQEASSNQLYVARPSVSENKVVRVNPDDLSVDSLHQTPGMAIGPAGEIYVSWSSRKPRPEGTLFASDLRLSRSLDGGQSFAAPLRVNEDRPISHSFEGLTVAADGTVLMTWIDSREGWDKAGTYLARITQRGTQVESVVKLDSETCVCCRVDVTSGPQNVVAVIWRKVFPGNVRDMVLSLSHDGGRTFLPSTLIHADRWHMPGCPHRGGVVEMDGKGGILLSWYTEGTQEEPSLLFTRSSDGQHFPPPQRLNTSTTSVPDHLRMVADTNGRAVIVWEEATAVRRRILLRYTTDGGQTFSTVHTLSEAIKAYAPDVAVTPTGDFVVVWHEEQFPALKTMLQTVRLETGR